MNSALAELSGVSRTGVCRAGLQGLDAKVQASFCLILQNYTSAPHCLEALQGLYNHIHRYYDQVRPSS